MVFQKGHGMNKGKNNPMYGKPSWNKDKPWPQKHRKRLSKIHKESPACKKHLIEIHKQSKGKHYSPNTEFKKGMMPAKFKGRSKHALGYIWIYSPNHPFADKRKNVLEHRLVVEKFIGRYIRPEEVTHHINEIKGDNRPENLYVFKKKGLHNAFHLLVRNDIISSKTLKSNLITYR